MLLLTHAKANFICDTHKTTFEFGGLEFDCYFDWNRIEQHGTFIKWFQYPSMKTWYRNGVPHCPPLGTMAFQSSKICPPNSIVDFGGPIVRYDRRRKKPNMICR